ncbi:MAG: hypothetical protein AABZ47_18140 [Planctomycetota bacterium]
MQDVRRIREVDLKNRTLQRGIILVCAACSITTSGCGVLNIPEEATVAINEWADREGETDPCRIDAMQHCVGASATASECGQPCALLLGSLLELSQGDGDPMDFHNNEAGAACQQQLTDSDTGAIACCQDLLIQTPSALQLDGRCR